MRYFILLFKTFFWKAWNKFNEILSRFFFLHKTLAFYCLKSVGTSRFNCLIHAFNVIKDLSFWKCFCSRLKACDVMDKPESYVYIVSRVSSVIRMLRTTAHNAFPVVFVADGRNLIVSLKKYRIIKHVKIKLFLWKNLFEDINS